MLIIKPIITEKSIRLAEAHNQYTFEVRPEANTSEAAKELEKAFNVTVGKVRTHNRLGKKVRFGKVRKQGKRSDRKFMIFELTKGTIDGFK